MTAIAYAVSNGEYSGYAVAAIFSTLEKAKAWTEIQNKKMDDNRVKKCGNCDGTGKIEIWVNPANKWIKENGIYTERKCYQRCWICSGTGKWESSPHYYKVEKYPLDPGPDEDGGEIRR